MGRYQVHRSDANAKALYGWLEAYGAQVVKLGRPVDALLAFRGHVVLVEVKMPKGKLRKSQREFLPVFRGLWAILRTPADCAALLTALEGSPAVRVPAALQVLEPS